MALTNPGLIESAERINQNNNSNGAGYTGGGYYGGGYYGGGYSGSDYSGGGDYSGGNNYNPYANGVPQSVIDAENELNQKSIPNQDYAQQVQDTIIRDQLGYLNDPNYQGKYTSQQTAEAFEYLSRTEGIIPAIESAHAVSYAMKIAGELPRDESIIITISGRGDKDCAAIARYRGEDLRE